MSQPDPDAKAQNLRPVGKAYFGAAFFVLLLTLIFIAALTMAPPPHPEGVPWLLATMVIAMFALTAVGSIMQGGAHDRLAGILVKTQEARDVLKKSLVNATNFIVEYRPTKHDIERVLMTAAHRVRRACEAENQFHQHGLLDVIETALPADPEERTTALQKLSESTLATLKAAVKQAKEEFWRLWHLAKDRGYDLLPSWQPYACLPWEPKKLVPPGGEVVVDGVVVHTTLSEAKAEGQNEEPGQ